MADSANTVLTTNFNVSPYYDDFDQTKNFYRILYKPGHAVQARELTQSQSILQKQISRLGNHIFKEGSIVIPGTFTIHTQNSIDGPVDYVKVKDADNNNNDVDISQFDGQKVVGLTNNVEGEISFVVDGSEIYSNTKTIYVDYTKASNTNTSIKTFRAGEILSTNVGNLVVVSTAPTGRGSAFRISEGVLYAKEHFIYFPTQKIIIDRYNSSPTAKVGFQLSEEIVAYTDDISLLDPALESSNYSAPGADRFKIHGTLAVRPIDDADEDPNFVTLFTVRNGLIETIFDRSQYNILQDELAKRTYDESGNYYVRGFDVAIREHLEDGTNGGLLTAEEGGDSDLLSVQVAPGLGYVSGYEVQKLVTSYLTTEKATNFETVNSQLASASMGSYVQVKEFTGSWTHDTGIDIDLYDTAQQRLSTSKWSVAAQTGKKIGTAKLMSLEYENGVMGTPDASYNMYISDIKMLGSNVFSNVRSVYYNNASVADVGADLVLSSANTAVLKEAASKPLLYYVGSDYTKTVNPNEASDTTFVYKTTSTQTNVASGIFNVTSPAGPFAFPYGTSTLTTAQKREILLTLDADANVAITGTVSNTGNTLTTATADFTLLNVGDKIKITDISGVYYINSIANSTHLTVSNGPFAATVSGKTFVKQYKTGDVIDLTLKGITGVTRDVTSTPTLISFDLKESLRNDSTPGAVPATLSYRVAATSARQIGKQLRSDRYVKIQVLTTTTGPFNLGIPDVFRIKEIRQKTGDFSSNTQGTVVTNSFVFDNGQKDTHYDHATIKSRTSLTAGTYLLVKLDYFEPDFTVGRGFFSIDSYPINDSQTTSTTIKTEQIPVFKSPVSGQEYDLRNNLDFRPIKTRTAADSTTVSGASVNPATSSTFNFDSNGLKFPVPFSQITFDYQYYLARKDVVILGKNKIFDVVRGIPAASPITPDIPNDTMSVATLTIAPYPSLSLFYANQINRKDLACFQKKTASVRFTMRDIGVLKDRIVNLEKYASLSLLEKNALDLKILDVNGIDRFKNGIFVDTFANHNLGALYDQDYRIVVDPEERSIRPLFNMDSISYDFLGGVDIKRNGDIVTLNYAEVPFLTQTNVTLERNTERTTYRFVGRMDISPSDDIFVDTTWQPDQTVTFTSLSGTGTANFETSALTTTWNSWSRYVSGYRVYRGNQATAGSLVGTYTSALEAQAVADQLRTTTNVTIETLYESSRTGVESWTESGTETHSLGDKVVDVDLVPYIRPQVLLLKVNGLKPFTRHYAFFDNVNMSAYARPLTETEYNRMKASKGIATSPLASAEGAQLLANSVGELYVALRLPSGAEKRFYTGTKEVLITDSNIGYGEDQTSFSRGYFVAQGLVETKQESILSTRLSINKQRTVYGTRTEPSAIMNLQQIVQPPPIINNYYTTVNNITQNNTYVTAITNNITNVSQVTNVTNVTGDGGGGDGGGGDGGGGEGGGEGGGDCCIGYAFRTNAPAEEEGVFITSLDLFFSQKHPTLGVWFEMLETDSTGKPTRKQIPFSEVWLKNHEVKISTNGKNNPTRITFQAPIFLENKKVYFIAVHPEAVNANYYLWASRIGETDINTQKPVNSRLYSGTTFTTNNGTIWDIVPDVDLTFNFYRASFVTNAVGSVVLGNTPKEKMLLENLSTSITKIGETYVNGSRITLTNITGGSISNNDLLVGGTSAVNSKVRLIATKYLMANTGYVVGETVTARHSANGGLTGVTATISAVDETANAVIQKVVESASNVIAVFNNSDGNFRANDRIISVNDRNYSDIKSIENFRYSVIDHEPSYLNFTKTRILFNMATYSNTGTLSSFVKISPNQNYYFDEEKAIFSRSKEVQSFSSARTNRVRVDMFSATNYLSPVLDLGRTHSVIVDSIINNDATGETDPKGGNLINKYISKIITLAEGQDAEDMAVYLTSYRPPGTDVKVWAKILHAEDGDPIAIKNWIELEKKDFADALYSSSSNRNDFLEYTYGFPESYKTGEYGQVQYSSDVATFTGYKYFAIKIGLMSNNSAIIPRVADLRVIALQI